MKKLFLILFTLLLVGSSTAQTTYVANKYQIIFEDPEKDLTFDTDAELVINEKYIVLQFDDKISTNLIKSIEHLIDEEAIIYNLENNMTIMVYYSVNIFAVRLKEFTFIFYKT